MMFMTPHHDKSLPEPVMPALGERLAWRPEPQSPQKKIIQGPELWKLVDGHAFCYWDRWFLRLAVRDVNGLDGLMAHFEALRRDYQHQKDAEVKLAHGLDLELRLRDAGLSIQEVLGDVDAVDEKLAAKARTKVLEQAASYWTPPMQFRPRVRLKARSRSGYWRLFPISPAGDAAQLQPLVDAVPFHAGRAAMDLAMRLEKRIHRANIAGLSHAKRLALLRAGVTVIADAMECTDDSFGMFGQLFGDIWRKYLAVPWQDAGCDATVFYRDLVEFVTWEDYALVDDMTGYFSGVAAADVTRLEGIIAETVTTLGSLGFEYEATRARGLRIELWVAHRRFDRFVPAAREFGTQGWRPIERMMECAREAGRFSLAGQVFEASGHPDSYRDLRSKRARPDHLEARHDHIDGDRTL